MGGLWELEKVKENIWVSFIYFSGERSVVLLDMDFDADNQYEIVGTLKNLAELIREINIDLAKGKT